MLSPSIGTARTGRAHRTRPAFTATTFALFALLFSLSLLAPLPAEAAPAAEPAEPAEVESAAKNEYRFLGKKRSQPGETPATSTTPPKPPKPPKSKKKSSPPPKPAPKATAPSANNAPPADNVPEEEKKSWFQRRKEAREAKAAAAAAAPPEPKPRPTSKPKARGGGWFKRAAPAPPLSTDDPSGVVRLQIFLDQSHFGPGKIDGKLGGFTKKAIDNYNRSRGIEAGNWQYVIRDASRAVHEPHRTYIIRAEDWDHIGSLSYEPAEQAEKTYMSYRSMRELVSERFHTSEAYLGRANPDKNLYQLKTGDEIIVPNIPPFRIEAIAFNQKFPKDPSLSARHLVVDTKANVAFIHEAGETGPRLVAAFPVTPGAERYVPYGDWNISSMVTTPTFRYDKMMLEEGVRGDEFFMIPPGPNSPVGIFWAGLTKSGIGLHGTNNPDTIGRAHSAGCIRLANWDAIRLSQFIRPGATVEVR